MTMDGPLCDTVLTGTKLKDMLLSSSPACCKLANTNGHCRKVAEIVGAKIIGDGSGMTSKVLRVHLQWADNDNSCSSKKSLLPGSCIVKVIESTTMKRVMNHVPDHLMDSMIRAIDTGHDIECRIYELHCLRSNNKAVPMPACYAASRSSGGPEAPGIIVLEDFTGRIEPTSFINLCLPLPEAQLHQVIEVLTSLHAWSVNEKRWMETIPSFAETLIVAPINEAFKEMFPACKKAFPEEFEKLDDIKIKKYFSVDKLIETFGSDPKARYNLPLVLVHGDVHPMNMLFEKKKNDDHDDGKLLALIDWQAAHQGCAMEDMARVMILCAPNEDQQGRDRILVKYVEMFNEKVEKLEHRVSFDDCKKALAEMFAFNSVLWSFTSIMADDMANKLFKDASEEEREAFKNRLLQVNFKHLDGAIEAYGW